MAATGTPAAIEMTSARGLEVRRDLVAAPCGRICGLTESTTISAWRTTSALCVVVWMP